MHLYIPPLDLCPCFPSQVRLCDQAPGALTQLSLATLYTCPRLLMSEADFIVIAGDVMFPSKL